MPDAILFTRRGCHLCDDAQALLERHGISPRLVDIDGDALLRERYNECVPVVVIDGKERFRGRINEVLLTRLLRHLPMSAGSGAAASGDALAPCSTTAVSP